MFLMKNKFVLFVTGCFALMLSACLDSDYDYSVETTRNCQIASFKVSHDSISGLEDVKFTIDQLTGRIFNQDSLPYGTVVEKVPTRWSWVSRRVRARTRILPII